MSQPGTKTPRLVLRLLALALAWLAIEAGCLLLLVVALGRFPSPAVLATARSEAHSSASEVGGGEARDQANAGLWSDKQAAHPFVGAVVDVDLAGAEERIGPRQINPWGFFGPLPFPAPGEDDTATYRVAVIGGSFAVQLCLEAGDTLATALGPTPAVAGRAVRVHCLGQAGMRQPQQLTSLAFFLAMGARFDLVLEVDGYNDVTVPVAYNWRKGIFPAFPFGWDLRISHRPDRASLAAMGKSSLLARLRTAAADLAGRPVLHRSFLVGASWLAVDRFLAGQQAAIRATLSNPPTRPRWQRASDEFAARGPELTYDDEPSAQDAAIALWARSSLAMAALAQGRGARYLHALQPNQYLSGSKPLSSEEQARNVVNPRHFYAPLATRGYPLLRAAGRQLAEDGIDFVDLTHLFANDPSTVYVDDCCHLNTEGYRKVALALAGSVARAEDPGAHPAAATSRP